jgi:hypothetical protein
MNADGRGMEQEETEGTDCEQRQGMESEATEGTECTEGRQEHRTPNVD